MAVPRFPNHARHQLGQSRICGPCILPETGFTGFSVFRVSKAAAPYGFTPTLTLPLKGEGIMEKPSPSRERE